MTQTKTSMPTRGGEGVYRWADMGVSRFFRAAITPFHLATLDLGGVGPGAAVLDRASGAPRSWVGCNDRAGGRGGRLAMPERRGRPAVQHNPCPAAAIPRRGPVKDPGAGCQTRGKCKIGRTIRAQKSLKRTFRTPARHRGLSRPAPGSEVPSDSLIGPPAICCGMERPPRRCADLPSVRAARH